MNAVRDDNILVVEEVSKSFPGVKALNNVSLSVKRNTIHGIVGENGAGKSTLMKILSGVYQKDEGTIIFNGSPLDASTPSKVLKRGLSIIYQEFSLINTLSVGENIFLGRFAQMKGMRNIHTEAAKLLKSIGSNIDCRSLVEDLSAAQKQMVEIAKALSYDADLIIMDEPSTCLTAEDMKFLREIIFKLKDRGITIIYISHKLDEIFEFCDEVTIMRDGCVIDTKDTKELSREEVIKKMVGRTIGNEYPERPDCAGDTVLDVRSINTKKLHDVSFVLRKGEILGFVGLVGAGRTEIVRAVFGADKARGHKVLINGKSITIKDPIAAIKAGIALIPEDRKQQGLILPFSVGANISMAALRGLVRFGLLKSKSESEIALRQIKALSIKTPSVRTVIESLSGGNQQKCVIGRWLETDSQILIMDEPTKGIDVGTKYDIYVLMKEFVERGGSIIMISSELPEVLNMSNRVLTICEGRINGEFNPRTASAEEIMIPALGLASGEEPR